MRTLARIAAVLLIAGCLVGGCAGDEKWLTAQLAGDRLTLEIGGQCGPESYLTRVRVATRDARVLWEVSQQRSLQPTPTVTLGTVPPGFREETPFGDLSGSILVFVDTNFSYVATIDVEALADGREQQFTPQPVWNEGSSVHPEHC
ncbi:hypothetical protein ACPCHT_30065 [Nucisporomicrobium flavum]|uniref:hypothetical protein n=1 Tax=Nucisporomicrobium flavum TaxID=2785915 RepID=UPI003C2CDA0B